MDDQTPKTYRILVADDEETNLELFRDVLVNTLKSFGDSYGFELPALLSENDEERVVTPVSFQLVTCRQGDEAVSETQAAIRENRFFSVAFMDVRMPPGPDGIWAAEKIRALDPNVEIVIITGYSDFHPREIAKRVPPSHKLLYAHKPFHIHEIFQAASSLSAKWENERELEKNRKTLELRVSERTRELAMANEALEKDIAIRRETEQVLRENEERYRILTESMADGVVIIRDNTIRFANPAYANMFEYDDPEKMIGLAMDEFIDPEFVNDWHVFIESIMAQTEQRKAYQFRCVLPDGGKIWVEGRFNHISWREKPVILATTRDISEQKERELAMQKETRQYQHQITRLRSSLKDRYRFGEIIGKSAPMQEVYELIVNAGASETNVVIYGESGTGKELIARTIHELSVRRKNKFIPVNCGAVPETLFESEFFGHKKGSFTGAVSDHPGFFEQARQGTLFLDEVGEFTMNMQVKMLRAMEGGGYTPVGGTSVKNADVRIVAATNRDLRDMLKKGLMREDFFYRLNVVPIRVPPLRDRKEDVPLLVEYFMSLYSGPNSGPKEKPTIPGKMMDTLRGFDWPGNIRQLQNVLQRFTTLRYFDISELTGDSAEGKVVAETREDDESMDFRTAVQSLEKRLILRALEKNQWHKANAAEMLGLPRRTFFRKLKDYEL